MVDGNRGIDGDPHLALSGRDDVSLVIVAIAVEQDAAIADARAQHSHQVCGGSLGERQLQPGLQRLVDEAPVHPHAVASSITARVTSASSDSCASSTQYGGIQ